MAIQPHHDVVTLGWLGVDFVAENESEMPLVKTMEILVRGSLLSLGEFVPCELIVVMNGEGSMV